MSTTARPPTPAPLDGHPTADTSPYIDLALEIGQLVTTKQQQYGNSFGEAPRILEILYPRGVPREQYADLLCIVRILDKLKRIATNHASDREDPWQDIIGYALLALQSQRSRTATPAYLPATPSSKEETP